MDGLVLGHDLIEHVAKPATCTVDGNSAYWECDRCGLYFSDEEGNEEIDENSWIIEAKGHTLTKTAAKKATCTKAGNSAYFTCSECGKYFSDEEGKTEIKKDSWVKAKLGHKYGKYKVTRVAKPSKSGILTKTCTRSGCKKKVNMVIAPVVAKATVKTNTKAVLSWTSVKHPKGYAMRYKVFFASCGKDSVKYLAKTTKLSYTKKSLKKGTAYKFKIKAQCKIGGKWKTISTSYLLHFVTGNLTKNGKYTNPKSISVAKAAVSLKVGKTSKIKPSMKLVKPGKKLLEKSHAVQYRYLSTNTDIAKVSSTGKITAKKKGTCKVYVIGVNGVSKYVKVTVK